MADRKKGIDDETRRVLADLASRAGTRISGRQRARWEPGNVSNPQDRYLSGVFTDEAAWSLVAEKLRDGHEVETMVLDHPPGATGYVLKIEVEADAPRVYVKLELLKSRRRVVGRSFHYSIHE
ncbi:MAG: hypothetical protein OXH70_08725 [Acidobacteria bacterium]|nr:hypothetical protein [Acidobacteriota bacterium]